MLVPDNKDKHQVLISLLFKTFTIIKDMLEETNQCKIVCFIMF